MSGDELHGMKRFRSFAGRHLFLSSVLISVLTGIVVQFLLCMSGGTDSLPRNLEDCLELLWISLAAGGLVGIFGVFPPVLTAMEVFLAFAAYRNEPLYRKGRIFDVVGIPLGIFYNYLFLEIYYEAVFQADWQQTLINRQHHTPVWTQAQPTFWALVLLGCCGYLLVNFLSLKRTPPLIPVLGISAMYLGTAQSVLWAVQTFRAKDAEDLYLLYLLVLPANCLLITARTVMHKIREWNQLPSDERKTFANPLLQSCNHLLARSEYWPLAAFVLMWPLLGLVIAVLLLFGQKPDAVIRAFTETSDWNLSQRVAPQNVMYDEHYLCTVAAGGHERIVKPKRLGIRHGHQVVVNRQLCVANAFEQILEERTPKFHRAVRRFYDTCGFPVARMIHSKYTADLIYILMKPLEWMFLAVLYLTDVHPENRIAIQYTGRNLKDFERVCSGHLKENEAGEG